ncbi:hypothetical protein [Shumkonia mesophila]|uniref:hypothetical protein n=1 Tax=Shumkonia mesophila TaxID=2838854 RepID=UPI002934FC23|nr:hypothetical protein [Shumkonia mesophila]
MPTTIGDPTNLTGYHTGGLMSLVGFAVPGLIYAVTLALRKFELCVQAKFTGGMADHDASF